ncbi:TraM recognition domain-containing protein [Streptomyces sp. SID13031]|uniref:TraM recognition domain-containing protein n=1 Tax=Streptomyces sp. SID13031 TaxID=2706046 RepID=UPI0013C6446B|nr:TraM recognition domain-containing protein [Streptomyces sp. SID13031]NEA36406.1 TraM recognition domain-containing protein [Streptomyces sp. SID13031]
MAQGRKSTGPGGLSAESVLVFIGIGLFALIVGGTWVATKIAAAINHTRPIGDPMSNLVDLINGRVRWSGAATGVLILEIVLLGVLTGVGFYLVGKARNPGSRVDRSAQLMSKRSEIYKLTRQGAQEIANRLGAGHAGPGVMIGRTVRDNLEVFGSWEDMHVDIWGPRTGKALAATTPVLTPHGWVPIKDLARGCRVIGSDGHPIEVTGVYPQGTRPAYRFRLTDGTSVLCDPDHLWTVRPKIRADKKHPEAWRTWTTRQLIDRGLRRMSGGAKYYLPIVEPVQFEGVLEPGRLMEAPPPDGRGHNLSAPADRPTLPVAPYLLGVLIGDGGLRSASIRLSTAEAQDLLPLLAPLLPAGVTAKPVAGSAYDWSLTSGRTGPRNALMAAMRELGLMGHSSLTKFVPPAYLLAAVEDRRALLAGLLDTDGSIDQRGVIEFSTSSPQLSEDFRFLVQSLGGTVTTTRRETTHAPSYRSLVRLPADIPAPFRLRRKRERWDELAPHRRVARPVRAIESIEPEGEMEMVCISVAATDGLFVTDEFIVTHNTTSRAVPAILDAPGAVVATSNKRDIVDATRDPRSKKGPIWVFDPQEVCGESPDWWWNPLSYVTDEVKARELAEHFVASQRKEGAQTDAFFDSAGTDLLAGLLLAAAVAKRPITQVYSWLADQRNDEPERILRSTPGLQLSADALSGVINAPDKQRAGVYGTAQQSAQFLINRKVTRWVIPAGPNDNRPQFNPHQFVREGGTLYSLSKEGAGTAGPLVTALTVAVVEAAEDYAKTCPMGRLPNPLLGVLDEAANVCRWKNLPDLYSHFGSRGIVLMTILQSWAQGMECWGERGMEKLWSAANIRVYGGGASDANFLERLSKLIGDYDILSSSVSYNKGERGTSKQTQRHHIMEVSDLAAMPPGRAVVFPSGIPATMIKTVPWMARPDAGLVKASLAHHDPGAALTAQGGANAWIAAGRPGTTAPDAPAAPSGPPVPIWEQTEEQRRGW